MPFFLRSHSFLATMLATLLALAACNTPASTEKNSSSDLAEKYDSLMKEMQSIKELLVKQATNDTVKLASKEDKNIKPATKEVQVNVDPKKELPNKEKTQKEKEGQKEIMQTSKGMNDTVYHYFSNRKLSVKEHPFNNGRRKIEVFDYMTGKVNIELEDVRMSFSVSHRLRFRNDGSLERVSVHENPGASRYWYECEMTFSNTNEPQWQTCQQMPMDRVEFPSKYYWDKSRRQWIKQEIIIEQPVPDQYR